MALVHDSVGDFVLFAPPDDHPDRVSAALVGDFAGFHPPMHIMDHHPHFAALSGAPYDTYTVTSGYPGSSAFYDGARLHGQAAKNRLKK